MVRKLLIRLRLLRHCLRRQPVKERFGTAMQIEAGLHVLLKLGNRFVPTRSCIRAIHP